MKAFMRELEKALTKHSESGEEYLTIFNGWELPVTFKISEALKSKTETHDDFVLAAVKRDVHYESLLDYFSSTKFLDLLNKELGYPVLREIRLKKQETDDLNDEGYVYIKTKNKSEKEEVLKLNEKIPNAYITKVKVYLKSPDEFGYLPVEEINALLFLSAELPCCEKIKQATEVMVVSTIWEPFEPL